VLFVRITVSEQVVYPAVAQLIIVTFLANENVKPPESLMGLRAQLGDETVLSRFQICEKSKSSKEGRTEVENMRRLHILQGKL
jgi:hypothetical protein